MATIKDNLKYSKEHEWVSVEGDIATIGITDFAQGELGDIVYVDVPAEGDEFAQDEVFGSIEAVKTVSDLFIPVSGEIVEINEALEDAPESINEDAYSAWIVKVKMANPSEVDGLLDAQGYKEITA